MVTRESLLDAPSCVGRVIESEVADDSELRVSTAMHTPIGPIEVTADRLGIRALTWPGEDGTRVGLIPIGGGPAAGDGSSVADRELSAAHLHEAVAQLDEYFDGRRRTFELPLHLVGTEFQRAAWRALLDVPYGETSTYGCQAERLGNPKAVRAVGAANGRNAISIVVPCHRVIGASGNLTGFAAGIDTKRWLLDLEAGRTPLPLTS